MEWILGYRRFVWKRIICCKDSTLFVFHNFKKFPLARLFHPARLLDSWEYMRKYGTWFENSITQVTLLCNWPQDNNLVSVVHRAAAAGILLPTIFAGCFPKAAFDLAKSSRRKHLHSEKTILNLHLTFNKSPDSSKFRRPRRSAIHCHRFVLICPTGKQGSSVWHIFKFLSL